MYKVNDLNKVIKTAHRITIDDSSKIILMGDCHRGDGSWADDFYKNRNIYYSALNYYYNNNYTYIELGDGDELWENRRYKDIIDEHRDVFFLLSRFHNEDRLFLIFGNHDMYKKNESFVDKNLKKYFDKRQNKYIALFRNPIIHESVLLKYKETGNNILLIHGHQVDFLNYNLWKVAKFLVRHLWRPLELIGVNDPISTAKNNEKRERVGKKLIKWVLNEKHMLISGHTHRPVFPKLGEPLYFNVGCCVNPNYITGIEIANGNIYLVKWDIKTQNDGTLYVKREIVTKPRRLVEFFNQEKVPITSGRFKINFYDFDIVTD